MISYPTSYVSAVCTIRYSVDSPNGFLSYFLQDFWVLIPWNCQQPRLRKAIQQSVTYAKQGVVAPTGVIFKAKWIRAQREQEILHAFKSGKTPPMGKVSNINFNLSQPSIVSLT